MGKFLGFPEFTPHPEAIESLQVVVVRPGEAGYDKAWTVPVYVDEPENMILPQIHRELAYRHWWVQSYWHGKGLPTEQYGVAISTWPAGSTLYVYGEPLWPEQLDVVQRTYAVFARLRYITIFRDFDTLVFDNRDFQNPYSGEIVNGESGRRDRMMWISWRGRQLFPHRIDAVPNLKGTLLHECAHVANSSDCRLEANWRRKFGWRLANPSRKLPGGSLCNYIVDEPERCVTSYATLTPGDDIADSVVVALKAQDRLDPDRLAFLRERFFQWRQEEVMVSITKRDGKLIGLPVLQRPLYVRLMDRKPPISVRATHRA